MAVRVCWGVMGCGKVDDSAESAMSNLLFLVHFCIYGENWTVSMLRVFLLLAMAIGITPFTATMCSPRLDDHGKQSIASPTDGMKIIPIVCKPGLRLRDVPNSEMRKLVYEATFEDDRIVIRPRRRKKRSSFEQLWRWVKGLFPGSGYGI